MNTQEPKTYELRALTDIWTGDAKGERDRTIATGLLGSIRWWFEVLVRGLGGSACDPTKHQCEGNRHCVVCELFGCTGWARKLRFEVLDQNGEVKAAQIKEGESFKLRFTPLRSVRPEEWALLDLTLRLIADYGAIGGKTVLKPSDEPSRANADHHRDYGLIEIQQRPEDIPSLSRKELEEYISQRRWRRLGHDDFAWASLANFWCVKGKYLARQHPNASSFNKAIGRKESKGQSQQLSTNDDVNRWLAGSQQRSKKVFSFKEPDSARRTFGFVNLDLLTLKDMRQRLKGAWPDLKDGEFVRGPFVLERLLAGSGEGAP